MIDSIWLSFLPLDSRRLCRLRERLGSDEETIRYLQSLSRLCILISRDFCVVNPGTLLESRIGRALTRQLAPFLESGFIRLSTNEPDLISHLEVRKQQYRAVDYSYDTKFDGFFRRHAENFRLLPRAYSVGARIRDHFSSPNLLKTLEGLGHPRSLAAQVCSEFAPIAAELRDQGRSLSWEDIKQSLDSKSPALDIGLGVCLNAYMSSQGVGVAHWHLTDIPFMNALDAISPFSRRVSLRTVMGSLSKRDLLLWHGDAEGIIRTKASKSRAELVEYHPGDSANRWLYASNREIFSVIMGKIEVSDWISERKMNFSTIGIIHVALREEKDVIREVMSLSEDSVLGREYFELNGVRFYVVCADQIGRVNAVLNIVAALKSIREVGFILSAGIAATTRVRELGFDDLIVPQLVVDGALRKQKGGRAEYRPETFRANIGVYDQVAKESFRQRFETAVRDSIGSLVRRNPRIDTRHRVLSTDAVVASAQHVQELCADFPDTGALDMESSACAAVAERLGLRFFCIRGISDDAFDNKQDDSHRATAMRCALLGIRSIDWGFLANSRPEQREIRG